jgi:hypothetical protein
VVHVEDGVCATLELLPIVSRERTSELLGAELARRGFVAEGGVARRAEGDGVAVAVDLATGTVQVTAEASAKIVVEKEVAGATLEAAQAQANAATEAEAKAAEGRARTEVAARLEGRLRDLRRELDAAVTHVTAEALKEKARSIGQIEEIHEDRDAGELTIKVRL